MTNRLLQEQKERSVSSIIVWVCLFYLMLAPFIGVAWFLEGWESAATDTQPTLAMHLKQILVFALLVAGFSSRPFYKYKLAAISWALLATPPLIMAVMLVLEMG